MLKTKNLIVIILVLAVLALAAIVLYLYNDSKQKDAELTEVVEMMNIEKDRVEDEYVDLTYQFDGYTSTIRNDSLLKLLDSEKSRVQELLDELRNTKATNARKIQELKDELASVRKIMMHLVTQIDSLNTENLMLRNENSQIKMKYEESSQKVDVLSKEKENLSEVVTRASKLEVIAFNVTTLNDRNRKTSIFSRIANLQFDYTIAKNITAEPGKKVLYVRITRPDGELLTKNAGNVFPFENRKIAYSAKKEYEYGSEAIQDVIYWQVEEILHVGTYRVDFFTDGDLIGSYTFVLKK
jgi:regulator of replication initiation timing